jgi:hypothetical protein
VGLRAGLDTEVNQHSYKMCHCRYLLPQNVYNHEHYNSFQLTALEKEQEINFRFRLRKLRSTALTMTWLTLAAMLVGGRLEMVAMV